ncbi:helix-turn-helix transcriptional regulator [Gordonia sp. 'Campus']|uniref:ArsR/SmtB family transcription factor n=1 Tax=Gordonia sp. 'Campus' TaxID=2915824 RepID=UPI001EE42322|nr:metalloregulator ArsR/SmtB family transcription factor [Gordonia sp. 'Campus']
MDGFEAIADPVRRSLVARLARGPARVVDLAADHPISRPAISRHLRLLGEAGVVSAVDHGRERHYELVPGALDGVREFLDAVDGGTATPRFDEHHLDALDLEVRRTVREREQAGFDDGNRPASDSSSRKKETG